MMRKFPKLLAVVLAIAIIICPAMCLTSMAESTNSFNIEYDAEKSAVTVTVTAEEGFMVSLLRLKVKGFEIKNAPDVEDPEELAISVAAVALDSETPAAFSASTNLENDVLSILLAPSDNMDIQLAKTATVTIPVTTAAEECSMTLTTVQAATNGTVVGDQISAEKFIDFPFVVNDEDGAVDLVAAGDNAVAALIPCDHSNIIDESVEEPTCDVDGVTTYTCECGYTWTVTTPALGHDKGTLTHDADYHWYTCTRDDSHIVEKTAHDFTNGDCVCGAKAPVEECQHENWSVGKLVNVTATHFEYENCVCSDCGEPCSGTIPIGTPLATQTRLSFSLDPKDSVDIIFNFNQTLVSGYTNLALVAQKPIHDGTDTVNTYYFQEYSSYKNTKYAFYFDKLSAHEFGTEVTASLYGMNSNGEMILIGSRSAAVIMYAANYIGATGDSDLDRALADMILYGDAAQIYMDYNTENLCSNGLTEAQKGCATKDYPNSETTFTKIDTSTVVGDTTTAAGTVNLSRGLSPKSKVNININLKAYGAGTDPYDYYCLFTYYDAFGNPVAEPYKVAYSGALYSKMPTFEFDQCPISTLEYPVHADMYYGDPDEGGKLVASTNFSIETYIAAYVEHPDAATANLMKTMYAYGHSLAIFGGTPSYSAS